MGNANLHVVNLICWSLLTLKGQLIVFCYWWLISWESRWAFRSKYYVARRKGCSRARTWILTSVQQCYHRKTTSINGEHVLKILKEIIGIQWRMVCGLYRLDYYFNDFDLQNYPYVGRDTRTIMYFLNSLPQAPNWRYVYSDYHECSILHTPRRAPKTAWSSTY